MCVLPTGPDGLSLPALIWLWSFAPREPAHFSMRQEGLMRLILVQLPKGHWVSFDRETLFFLQSLRLSWGHHRDVCLPARVCVPLCDVCGMQHCLVACNYIIMGDIVLCEELMVAVRFTDTRMLFKLVFHSVHIQWVLPPLPQWCFHPAGCVLNFFDKQVLKF